MERLQINVRSPASLGVVCLLANKKFCVNRAPGIQLRGCVQVLSKLHIHMCDTKIFSAVSTFYTCSYNLDH